MFPYVALFGRDFSMYGICIFIGVALAFVVAVLRAKQSEIQVQDVFFAGLYGIIGLIIGAKILFILTIIPVLIGIWGMITENPLLLLEFFRGGFVFYGGLIGFLLGIIIYCRKYKFTFLRMADIMIPGIPLAHAFGRIGCYCAGCCYGIECSGPLCVVFPETDGIAPSGIGLFPIQLLESGLNFVLFVVLMLLGKRNYRLGRLTGFYIVAYGFMRFILEFFRGDVSRGVIFFSTSQWLSLVTISLVFFFSKQHLSAKYD